VVEVHDGVVAARVAGEIAREEHRVRPPRLLALRAVGGGGRERQIGALVLRAAPGDVVVARQRAQPYRRGAVARGGDERGAPRRLLLHKEAAVRGRLREGAEELAPRLRGRARVRRGRGGRARDAQRVDVEVLAHRVQLEHVTAGG